MLSNVSVVLIDLFFFFFQKNLVESLGMTSLHENNKKVCRLLLMYNTHLLFYRSSKTLLACSFLNTSLEAV